jgi:hypothetical protein
MMVAIKKISYNIVRWNKTTSEGVCTGTGKRVQMVYVKKGQVYLPALSLYFSLYTI